MNKKYSIRISNNSSKKDIIDVNEMRMSLKKLAETINQITAALYSESQIEGMLVSMNQIKRLIESAILTLEGPSSIIEAKNVLGDNQRLDYWELLMGYFLIQAV